MGYQMVQEGALGDSGTYGKISTTLVHNSKITWVNVVNVILDGPCGHSLT